MARFIMLTRLQGESIHPTHALEQVSKKVEDKIHSTVPNIQWILNYAIVGRYDYLDIFEAPDIESAFKVANVVRSFGQATVEIWPAMEWDRFKQVLATSQ